MATGTTEELVYPVDFVARVRAEYAHYERLLEHLDANSYRLGRYLDDSRHLKVSAQDIVSAFTDSEDKSSMVKLAELKVKAEQAIRRDALYGEWQEIVGFGQR